MLMKNWRVNLRLICLVENPKWLDNAKNYLSDLLILARMPKGYKIIVEHEKFDEYIEKTPHADLNIFGLAKKIDKNLMEHLVQQTDSTCMFVMDSGHESVLV
jgi:solute carrier family 12 (sodium/potassium/chloride transporter), member 2